MKKQLFMLILFSHWLQAQNKETEPFVRVSVGIDGRNIILGSEPTNNNPEPDVTIAFEMAGNNKFRLETIVEHFPRIKYQSLFVNGGIEIPIAKRLTTTATVGVGLIRRTTLEGVCTGEQSFYSAQATVKANYEILNNLTVGIRVPATWRTDKRALYNENTIGFSAYFEVGYKIPLK